MSDAMDLDEKLRFAIGDYWDIAQAESSDQSDTDDEAGSAQAKWSEIECLIRQLAEQRAELLEALILLLNEVDESAVANARDYGWPVAVAKSRAAIANATQQRNATGGEG